MGKRKEIEVPSLDIINQMRPDVPPSDAEQGRKEDAEVVGGDTLETEAASRDSQTVITRRRMQQEQPIERNAKSSNSPEEEEYLREFIYTPPLETVARHGKLAYLHPRHHDKILRIIQTIGKNRVNISTYLYWVLESHFEQKEKVIKSLYKKCYEEI